MSEQTFYFDLFERDKVDVNDDGFRLVMVGRVGEIYFVENKSIIPIGIELSGVKQFDILVSGEIHNMKYKYYPDGKRIEPLPFDDACRIQDLLIQWLSHKGIRHDNFLRHTYL